jgi:EAL domain-containing protein (putative c-di-GMP-specific phosphodiesterase class I)
MDEGQLLLHYQVQVDEHGGAVGAEALIRWQHPQRGLVPPAQFIPLAEETGLVLPIGDWVLERACAVLARWRAVPALAPLRLSVNISARQFHQNDFVAHVRAAVARHDIDPRQLTLELTESMLLENVEETVETMRALRQLGVRFSLDDFGTGYSSLQYLKRLPLDQIKIDRSFVRDLAQDASDRAIVATIITMARGFGLDVIAEGVETEAQHRLLAERGCTRCQGYLFGRPVPLDAFERALVPAASGLAPA